MWADTNISYSRGAAKAPHHSYHYPFFFCKTHEDTRKLCDLSEATQLAGALTVRQTGWQSRPSDYWVLLHLLSASSPSVMSHGSTSQFEVVLPPPDSLALEHLYGFRGSREHLHSTDSPLTFLRALIPEGTL